MLREQVWHPYRPQRHTDWLVVPRRAGRVARWAGKAPAERLTLPVAAFVWADGALLHALAVPWPEVALAGGVALPALTYAGVLHRSRKKHGQEPDDAAWRAGKAGIGVLVAGAWSATAARWGVLAGPYDMSSLTYWSLAAAGYGIVRADDVVRGKRDWRNEKLQWLREAPLYDLQGSHLLQTEKTRLGRRMLIDTKGTRKRASVIASRHTAELIAEHKGLPVSRVQVTPDRIAGRVWISIRIRDPWAHAIPHPVLDDSPEIALPERQSVCDPLIVGQDPETGKPLTLQIYDREDGANGILIVGVTGAGKTVLQNCIMERLSACDDALVWDINLSKGKENRRWAPAFDLKAHGPTKEAKRDALAILRLALKVIEYRGMSDSDDAVHQPTPEDPLIVLRVDEADALQGANDYLSLAIKEVLNKINSKKRSEAVGLIEAAQRGTISHTGTGDIRANFNTFAGGMTRGKSELLNAMGDIAMDLPDMNSYGEGHPGVWLFTGRGAGSGAGYTAGRTFFLKHLPDISSIAARRPPRATLPVGLREYLGDAYERLKTGEVTARQVGDEPAHQPWMDDLGKELINDMDEDLIDQMEALTAKQRATRQEQAGLDAQELPDLDPGQAAARQASRDERWRQATATIDVPPERVAVIVNLARDGIAMRELMAHLNLPKTTVWEYMAKLRVEGIVKPVGKGRSARWFINSGDARDDAQSDVS